MTPLLKLIKKQDTISLIILILLIPVVTRLNGRVNFIYILLTSNYITLILNIACLVLMYKKIMIINGINHTLITRKGYKNTKHNIYAFMIMTTLLFLAILYGFLFLVYGISQMSINLLLMLVIYTSLFLFEISIIYLQFNRKSNILYIALPIIINLICHYMFF
ncbi:hypothetical protein KSV96_05645 [Catenibacterium mitsuokai]|uniref:hypothetical protein n=1 Tax=Catenibacterium mitsuokai TaxID=100886 RepID=UPI001C39262E|nr:hypothetical protein [Catenibacterium mitsuokai]MBV3378196.1 hypothetical protein [Catenibacterium mitsuokai]